MKPQVITFHFELKDNTGLVIDTSRKGKPLMMVEGAGQIIPGLEAELSALETGKSKEVEIPYQEAYGPYDQSLVAQVPRRQFPKQDVKLGDVFQIEKKGDVRYITVIEVSEETVVIDANHPMAGKNLFFWIEVVDRRDATQEEIDHGHGHPGGAH